MSDLRPIDGKEWIQYLKETGEYESYDGLCQCYRCQDVRKNFERWKYEMIKTALQQPINTNP